MIFHNHFAKCYSYVAPECHDSRYITSDCDAVATIYEYQFYAKTAYDAVADALTAGLNLLFAS